MLRYGAVPVTDEKKPPGDRAGSSRTRSHTPDPDHCSDRDRRVPVSDVMLDYRYSGTDLAPKES
jgi:hypothetical protein